MLVFILINGFVFKDGSFQSQKLLGILMSDWGDRCGCTFQLFFLLKYRCALFGCFLLQLQFFFFFNLFFHLFPHLLQEQCCIGLQIPKIEWEWNASYLMIWAYFFWERLALKYYFLNIMLAGVSMSGSIEVCTTGYYSTISKKPLSFSSLIEYSFLDESISANVGANLLFPLLPSFGELCLIDPCNGSPIAELLPLAGPF